jgi:anthranilate phosphoribosyltransferase
MKTSQTLMHSIIQRIATGPDLSKNIDLEEAKAGMQGILRGEIDDVQSAIFLIALRMKRETMDENEGILAAILAESDRQQVEVDELVDLGDPYSGYNRSIPVSSFLPPLLAELGLPTIIHGLDGVSPKFGLTHRHINKALGLDVNHSTAQAKTRLETPSIGWSYIDQANYCQGLHDLVPLRGRLIKRTVINTVETGKKSSILFGEAKELPHLQRHAPIMHCPCHWRSPNAHKSADKVCAHSPKLSV